MDTECQLRDYRLHDMNYPLHNVYNFVLLFLKAGGLFQLHSAHSSLSSNFPPSSYSRLDIHNCRFPNPVINYNRHTHKSPSCFLFHSFQNGQAKQRVARRHPRHLKAVQDCNTIPWATAGRLHTAPREERWCLLLPCNSTSIVRKPR